MKTVKTILLIIIAAGAFVRLMPISWGLPSRNLALSSWQPDEQQVFQILERMKPRELNFFPGPALAWGGAEVYLVGAAEQAASLLGIIKLGSRQFYLDNLKELDKLYIVGRAVSVTAGVLSICLMYLVIMAVLQNIPAALLGAFLMAILPVHAAYSFYIRPDVLMLSFALCVMYFSVKIMEVGSRRQYVLCGAFAGLMISAKYSGLVYLVMPALAHLLYSFRSGGFSAGKLLGGNLRLGLLTMACVFIATCPYCLTPEFLFYFKGVLRQGGAGVSVGMPGWILYPTVLLPLGMGIPLVITGIAGWAGMVAAWLRDRDPKKLLLTFSGLAIYVAFSFFRTRTVVYALPIMPFFLIYSAWLFIALWGANNLILKSAGRIIVVSALTYSAMYSMGYLRLFIEKDVREEASEWIEKSIPRGSSVAIAKSFHWTPPVLRQRCPPYRLLAGGGQLSLIPEAVLGLKAAAEEADYLVLTEYEYWNYLPPAAESNKARFPEQIRIITDIFSEKDFRKVAEFDKKASFLGFTFEKDPLSLDWLFPNPKIVVFKKTR